MSIGKMKNVKKSFFKAVDVKKCNFNKPTYVEILKIHRNLLSCVLCLVWMCFQIPLTVLLRSDDLKRFIIPEHGKNDVADFMHDSPDSHVFLLAFAFVGIVAVDNRVYWRFSSFIHLEGIECHHMQDASGKA